METKMCTFFALVRENKAYIGKTLGRRVSAVYSRHRCGEYSATRDFFAKPYPEPQLHILSRLEIGTFEAYRYILVYIRLFRENGYEILNSPRSVERSEDLHKETERIFEKLGKVSISELLRATRVERIADADIKKPTAAEREKACCQLTIRLTKREKEQFQKIGSSLALNQHQTLLYLFDRYKQGNAPFLDFEGDAYLRAVLGAYKEENEKLRRVNEKLKEEVDASRRDKKRNIEQKDKQIGALRAGINKYFAMMESASLIPVEFETGRYQDFPERASYEYPENEGVFLLRPQKILYGKGRWGSMFILGIGDDGKEYRFRYYPKSYYAGLNMARSGFSKRGSAWLVGCEKAKDNAMDLIFAFPMEVRFRFSGSDEYGSQMSRDITIWLKESEELEKN